MLKSIGDRYSKAFEDKTEHCRRRWRQDRGKVRTEKVENGSRTTETAAADLDDSLLIERGIATVVRGVATWSSTTRSVATGGRRRGRRRGAAVLVGRHLRR